MKRPIWPAGSGFACLALAIAACEPYCPKGYDKRGDTCYRIKDAGADAATERDPDGGRSQPSDDSGDGFDGMEEDGATGAPDQDSGEVRDGAGPVPGEAPQIQGALSMAPGRELWAWTAPEGTEYFEVLLDDAAPPSGGKQTETRFSASLELGGHTIKVRACRTDGRCSGWAVHTTRVESFGSDLPLGLRDSARSIQPTALGHRVAIGCNDCADGPNSEVYNLEQAAASIERAIDRGADLIELNVASIGGALYASADSLTAASRPKVVDLLRREKIANADALIVLEVVESADSQDAALQDTEEPDEFARTLFSTIEEIPALARNGRPLWLRTSYANRSYIQALAVERGRHPVTGPYVRFVVSDPGRDPGAFYSAVGDVLIPSLDFLDAVSVDFRLPNLLFRLERIRAAGSAAVIENVPGPGHGELVLGALREQADAFITNYRVDQGRRILTATETATLFGTEDISADGRVLSIHGVRGGKKLTWEQELGGRFFADRWFSAAQSFQTPRVTTDSSATTFFGPYLSFQIQEVATALLVSNPEPPQDPPSGFLVSFFGTLPSPSIDAVRIVSAGSSSGGLALGLATDRLFGQLSQSTGDPIVVPVPFRGPSDCFSENQSLVGELDLRTPHWIVLAYSPARSELVLLVDGKCGNRALVLNDQSQDYGAEILLGGGTLGQCYQGSAQRMGLLRWDPPANDSQN